MMDSEEPQRYPSTTEAPAMVDHSSQQQQQEPLVNINLATAPAAGTPQSGMDGCEPADKCCGCLPIKCGMLLITVGTWFTYLQYF